MSITLPEGVAISASLLALIAAVFRGGLSMGSLSKQVDRLKEIADRHQSDSDRFRDNLERVGRHMERIEARCPLCREDEPSGPNPKHP
jgi:hypothetical protein